MNKVLRVIKEVPTWEKIVIVSSMIIPIPLTMEVYLGARTIIKNKKQILK